MGWSTARSGEHTEPPPNTSRIRAAPTLIWPLGHRASRGQVGPMGPLEAQPIHTCWGPSLSPQMVGTRSPFTQAHPAPHQLRIPSQSPPRAGAAPASETTGLVSLCVSGGREQDRGDLEKGLPGVSTALPQQVKTLSTHTQVEVWHCHCCSPQPGGLGDPGKVLVRPT